jgi:hypothetical protein
MTLNKAFNSFVQQSKKRLLQKEAVPETEKPTTAMLAGSAYDNLRLILLHPKTVNETDYFDTVNFIIKAWHEQTQKKGKKK